jgi:hypothetical protein
MPQREATLIKVEHRKAPKVSMAEVEAPLVRRRVEKVPALETALSTHRAAVGQLEQAVVAQASKRAVLAAPRKRMQRSLRFRVS